MTQKQHIHDDDTCCECDGDHCCCECPVFILPPDFPKGVVQTASARRTDCPECGSKVRLWYSPNDLDPGDVDPRADCTNPDCGWGY